MNLKVSQVVFLEEKSLRLDVFLAKNQFYLSRSQASFRINQKHVLVNGKGVKPSLLLKRGDQITFIPFEIKKSELIPENLPLSILFEDSHLIVINKAPGQLVHPGAGHPRGTLTQALLSHCKGLSQIGGVERPGIVHRLDKDVSGVMVVALTPSMFASLKEQFQSHTVFKEYLTLVHGAVLSEEAVIDFPLQRSKLSGKIVARARGAEGKESITFLVVSQRFSRYTYLKVAIQTGRTHQIRSHMQAYGHPIVGDSLYQNKKIKDNSGLKRLFLHAHLLRFQDLSGQSRAFRASLPLELKDFLDTLS